MSWGVLGEVVTLSLGPLSKPDLQDVQPSIARGKHRFGWYWGCFLPSVGLVAARRETAHSGTSSGINKLFLQQTVLGGQGGLAGRSAPCPVQPVSSLRGGELALSSSSVSDAGALLKQLALLAGLVCMLLLFALLPLPWPLPTPTPFCLYSLSFHSLERLAGARVC